MYLNHKSLNWFKNKRRSYNEIKFFVITPVYGQIVLKWRNKFGWGLGKFALQEEFKGRHISKNGLKLILGLDN